MNYEKLIFKILPLSTVTYFFIYNTRNVMLNRDINQFKYVNNFRNNKYNTLGKNLFTRSNQLLLDFHLYFNFLEVYLFIAKDN